MNSLHSQPLKKPTKLARRRARLLRARLLGISHCPPGPFGAFSLPENSLRAALFGNGAVSLLPLESYDLSSETF
jgi:hypothetical protein